MSIATDQTGPGVRGLEGLGFGVERVKGLVELLQAGL